MRRIKEKFRHAEQMLQELVHLTTAECACRHNYRAVSKLGNTINLKIFNYKIEDLEDFDNHRATILYRHKYLLMFYLTMPKHEDMTSQSNVHVGTQCCAFSKVQYFLFISIPIL